MLKAHDSSIVTPDDDPTENTTGTSTFSLADTNNTMDPAGGTAAVVVNDNGQIGFHQTKSPLDEQHDFGHPPVMQWVPRFWRFDHAPVEATGLSIDMYARGHIMMSSMFLGPALLELAQAAAKLNCNLPEEEEEDGNGDDVASFCKVYGFRPSSLLSNIAIFSGLLGSLSMPFIGAVVDHTPYRRQVAAVSALALATVKGLEIFVGPRTWFVVAVLQVVSYVLYDMHAAAAYAYTSELTQDHHEKAQYNASYNVIAYVSMLVFLIQVFGTASILGTDDVGTARIGQIFTATICFTCFAMTWKFLFRNRPAVSRLPPGHSLWTHGFVKVAHTARRIVRDYRALMWATIQMMFAEAAMTAFSSIATTYLKEVLDMTANEIALVFLVVLVMGIPGSYMGSYLSAWFNSPVKSAMICNAGFIVSTTGASIFLTGPGFMGTAVGFSVLWGIFFGWLSPMDTTIFMNLMPNDSQTELMGIMQLAADILSFLPALLFSVLNESGFNMAWGLASLNLFFGLAIVCLYNIGDYHRARRQVTSLAVDCESVGTGDSTGNGSTELDYLPVSNNGTTDNREDCPDE